MENGSGTLSFASSTFSYWLSWNHETGDAPTDEECVVPFGSLYATCDDDAGWIAPTAGVLQHLRTRSTTGDVRNDLTHTVSVAAGDLIRFSYEDTGGNVRSIVVQVNGSDTAILLSSSGSAGTTFVSIQLEFIPTALTSAE